MRILFDVLRDGLAAINTASRQLADAQQQVASGKRIASAADDPLAVQQSIGERATLGAIDAYSRTSAAAASRLATADSVLAGIGNKLTAATVAAVGARGSNVSSAARAAASAEVRSLRDAILEEINTEYQGSSMFAGTAVDQPAYARVAGVWTYQGNASVASVEIQRGQAVAVTFDGQSILQGSDTANVLTELDALAAAIDAGDNTAIGAGIDAVERAFDRTQRAIGALGASERAVDEAALRLSSLKTTVETRRSSLEDVNLAEAVTRMTQAESAYRAALTAVSTAERQSLLDYLR
jgi:flagellar hook-associated protein 3 FlgL